MIALSNLHFSNFISFENWRFCCIGCAFLQYSCYRRSYLFVSLFLSHTDKTCDKIETKFALSDFMKKELTFDLQLNSSLMLAISLGINRWSWRIHCMKDESKSCLFYCCNGFKIFSQSFCLVTYLVSQYYVLPTVLFRRSLFVDW